VKYYIALQALGDNLISLTLLKKLEQKVNILGTKHTENVAKLMNLEDMFNIEIVFDDIPAFYDIRKKGFLRAIKDLYKFVKFIQENQITEMIFEKKDFRSSVILFFTQAKGHYPDSLNARIYENRKELIENTYHQLIEQNRYPLKIENPKMIVINPLTRVELRNIKHNHLKYILDILNNCKYEIYLIDIEKKYQEFENEVYSYLTDTTLTDVKQLILECDLYVGGDSFLIHLAYYLERNCFIIFYRDNDDFLPLNANFDFYIKAHKNNDFNQELQYKFRSIGLVN